MSSNKLINTEELCKVFGGSYENSKIPYKATFAHLIPKLTPALWDYLENAHADMEAPNPNTSQVRAKLQMLYNCSCVPGTDREKWLTHADMEYITNTLGAYMRKTNKTFGEEIEKFKKEGSFLNG
jgi:hypothetical protein